MEAWAFENTLDHLVVAKFLSEPLATFRPIVIKDSDGEEAPTEIEVVRKCYKIAKKAEVFFVGNQSHFFNLEEGDVISIYKVPNGGNPLAFEIIRSKMTDKQVGHRETKTFSSVRSVLPRFLS